jgi:hypothetical protein
MNTEEKCLIRIDHMISELNAIRSNIKGNHKGNALIKSKLLMMKANKLYNEILNVLEESK